MKRFFRVIVIVVLGGIAAPLHMTLWKAWRAGAAWTSANCHEKNLGNFGECLAWRKASRPVGTGAV
jgi:hypothetical protein